MSAYDFKRINEIQKEFERKKNGNLMQYTVWLQKRILEAEKTISEFNLRLKKCSDKIEGTLQKGCQ